MQVRERLFWLLALAYAVMWVGGVVFRLRPSGDAPGWAAPAFLALAALLSAIGTREWRTCLLFAVAGFAVEVVGVRTGLPFGAYEYTSRMGPRVAGVPLSIACAWMTLLLFVRDLAWRRQQSVVMAALTGAAAMAAIDLLLDPVAVHVLGYWSWRDGGAYFGIPATNFCGWFVISAALLGLAGRPPQRSVRVLSIGASVVLFFVLMLALQAINPA